MRCYDHKMKINRRNEFSFLPLKVQVFISFLFQFNFHGRMNLNWKHYAAFYDYECASEIKNGQ